MDSSAHPRLQVTELVAEIVGRLHRRIDRICDSKGIPKEGVSPTERHKEKVVDMIMAAFAPYDSEELTDEADVDDDRIPVGVFSSETVAWFVGYMWLVELAVRAGDEFPRDKDGLMPIAPLFESYAESLLRGFTADDARQAIAESLSEAEGDTETLELIRMMMATARDAMGRVMN